MEIAIFAWVAFGVERVCSGSRPAPPQAIPVRYSRAVRQIRLIGEGAVAW